MSYECIAVTGFAGDRSPEAMTECHPFALALSEFLDVPVSLHGSPRPSRDLHWDDALNESQYVFSAISRELKDSIARSQTPILVTPRCASAIASLPIIVNEYPNVVILYFDAHGDLNTPSTSLTGYLGGMPLTAAMGDWDSGYGGGLCADNLVHIGGRDLEFAEHHIIRERGIMTLSKSQIDIGLDDLANKIRGRSVYVHIDTDVYDPIEVVAEYSVADGLSREHVAKVICTIQSESKLVGVEITELSPKNAAERERSHQSLFDSLASLLKTNGA